MSQPAVLPCVAGGLRVDGVAREEPLSPSSSCSPGGGDGAPPPPTQPEPGARQPPKAIFPKTHSSGSHHTHPSEPANYDLIKAPSLGDDELTRGPKACPTRAALRSVPATSRQHRRHTLADQHAGVRGKTARKSVLPRRKGGGRQTPVGTPSLDSRRTAAELPGGDTCRHAEEGESGQVRQTHRPAAAERG